MKCRKCLGRGGWQKAFGRFTLFVSCVECRGKGRWFPNSSRPKPGRKP